MIGDFGRNHVRTISIQDHQFQWKINLESFTSSLSPRIARGHIHVPCGRKMDLKIGLVPSVDPHSPVPDLAGKNFICNSFLNPKI